MSPHWSVNSFLVRETGLEPVRDYHTPLKRARLPIPPLSHIGSFEHCSVIIANVYAFVNTFFKIFSTFITFYHLSICYNLLAFLYTINLLALCFTWNVLSFIKLVSRETFCFRQFLHTIANRSSKNIWIFATFCPKTVAKTTKVWYNIAVSK
mgnify:CR=1 FL=1